LFGKLLFGELPVLVGVPIGAEKGPHGQHQTQKRKKSTHRNQGLPKNQVLLPFLNLESYFRNAQIVP
jgi:hypothetical protein